MVWHERRTRPDVATTHEKDKNNNTEDEIIKTILSREQ